MSSALQRLLGRLRSQEQSVRESIAELVQEADADRAVSTGDEAVDLDAQERALISNVLRLREITAADVFAFTGVPETFSLEKILRKPLLVAPQISVLDLLLQMRQTRTHLALVVDEYGGIDGLLTIEDLVETIVGDISDEHDEIEGPMLVERPDGALELNALLPVEAFEARLGPVLSADERDADIETVGGLVFNLAGRVPAKGEIIAHPSGIEFLVLEADARRIRRLRARRTLTPEAEELAAKDES